MTMRVGRHTHTSYQFTRAMPAMMMPSPQGTLSPRHSTPCPRRAVGSNGGASNFQPPMSSHVAAMLYEQSQTSAALDGRRGWH